MNQVLRIAKNEVENLTHGWFAVKNRSTQEIADGVTIEERHKREKTFFATVSPWTELKKDRTGIFALKAFLGGLLYDHIRNEFPEVVRDIEQLAASTEKELDLLGPSRQTAADQRRFLARIASEYQQNVTDALGGNYDPELSGDSAMKLRMHISRLNEQFAKTMAVSGHAKIFQDVEGRIDMEFSRTSGDKDDIMQWIRELYRESRGAELPGTVNPRVLENMFRQQSKPWQRIATIYIAKVYSVIQGYNEIVFGRLVQDEELRQNLRTKLAKGDKEAFEAAGKQLLSILKDERGGILQTVNHYFAENLSAIREERVRARLQSAGFEDGDSFDIANVMSRVHISNEVQAVNDIHDILKAYYKVAMKRFTDNVVLQVTERHLLGSEGPVKSLTLGMVGDLQDVELTDIAGENFSTSSTRNDLKIKFERFQKALDIARQAVI